MNWEMTTNMAMPTESTAYWCSFHKGPVLNKKHHIVAVSKPNKQIYFLAKGFKILKLSRLKNRTV
jgi:hypothetical protein